MNKLKAVVSTVRLGDTGSSISTGPFGTMLHKADYVEDGIPLVNPMNIVGGEIVPSARMMVSEATKVRLQNYVLREGDVVVARRGDPVQFLAEGLLKINAESLRCL